MITRGSSVLFLPMVLMILFVSGCGDDPTTTQPGDDALARAIFEGSFDGESFVLQRIEDPRSGVALDLVATDIRFPATGLLRIEVDVALRNTSRSTVYGPVRVFLGSFRPEGVMVTNSDDQLIDATAVDIVPDPNWPYPHFFGYAAAELGEDLMLAGGETSQPRTWQFVLPDLTGFSFGSEAWVGTVPGLATLGGTVFLDRNRDGIFQPDEPVAPFGANGVMVRFPGGRTEVARTDELGRWRILVDVAGIYDVHFLPPPTLNFAPVCLTTPDPLRVVIPTGPAGGLVSFSRADIGIDPEICPPPPGDGLRVQLFRGPADSVETDHFLLRAARLVREAPIDGQPGFEGLQIEIGYSGCSPGHPVRLFAGVPFMESAPPRTWLRISHDDRGELCDAYWEETLVFDLAPLRRYQREMYGNVGPLVLVLATPDGQQMRFELP